MVLFYSLFSPPLSLPLSLSTANPSVIPGVKQVIRRDGSTSSDRTFGMLVTGNPQPSFTWTHNGAGIQPSDDLVFLNSGAKKEILISPPFLFKHAGTYRISATNEHGTISDSFEMEIQGIEEREGGGRCEYLFSIYFVLVPFKHTTSHTHRHTTVFIHV